MLYFEHESEHEEKDKSVVLPYFGSEFVPTAKHREECYNRFLCLSGSQTKLKIIPNRKLTVFKDVIKDTNSKHE